MATKKKKPAPRTARAPNKAGSTNRTGSPPVGSIGEDAIERLVTQWVSRPKQAADYARLPRERVLAASHALLKRRVDLDAFQEACTPIKTTAFDYLVVIEDMLRRQPEEEDVTLKMAVVKSRAAVAAQKEALLALEAVLSRAEACGRPLRLYELWQTPWSPSGFITQLLHVVQAGRRRAEKWDDPIHAMGLFGALERHALALERAWKLPPIGSPAQDETLRTMALLRLLYDGVTYLAAYGRAVFPPGDRAHVHFTLQELFPRKAPAGLGAPLVLLGQ